MSRGKSILIVCYSLLFVLLCLWCCDLSQDYKQTVTYGYQFSPTKEMMISNCAGDIDYYKVTSYDGSNASVYYVDSEGCEGHLVAFRRENYKWNTVESMGVSWKSESAISEAAGLYWCLGNTFFTCS